MIRYAPRSVFADRPELPFGSLIGGGFRGLAGIQIYRHFLSPSPHDQDSKPAPIPGSTHEPGQLTEVPRARETLSLSLCALSAPKRDSSEYELRPTYRPGSLSITLRNCDRLLLRTSATKAQHLSGYAAPIKPTRSTLPKQHCTQLRTSSVYGTRMDAAAAEALRQLSAFADAVSRLVSGRINRCPSALRRACEVGQVVAA